MTQSDYAILYRHGSDWVAVLTGQPQDAVEVGCGSTREEALASLDATPVQSVGRDNPSGACESRWPVADTQQSLAS